MTTNDGPAQAGDVSGVSSAPTTVTAEKSIGERATDFAAQYRATQQAQASAEGGQRAVDDSTSTDADADADPTADLAGKGDAPEVEKDPETIPFKAFQKRLARETEKTRGAQQQLAAREQDLAKTNAVLQAVYAEYESFKQVLLEGGVDARDMTLREHALRAQAGQLSDAALQEHQAALQAQQEAHERQAVVSELREEMNEAVEAHPLVSFAELKAEMHRTQNTDATAVAKALQAQRLQTADKLRAPRSAPAHPASVRGAAANAASKFTFDSKGLAAYAAAHRNRS